MNLTFTTGDILHLHDSCAGYMHRRPQAGSVVTATYLVINEAYQPIGKAWRNGLQPRDTHTVDLTPEQWRTLQTMLDEETRILQRELPTPTKAFTLYPELQQKLATYALIAHVEEADESEITG